jgi:hypothetical protein
MSEHSPLNRGGWTPITEASPHGKVSIMTPCPRNGKPCAHSRVCHVGGTGKCTSPECGCPGQTPQAPAWAGVMPPDPGKSRKQ